MNLTEHYKSYLMKMLFLSEDKTTKPEKQPMGDVNPDALDIEKPYRTPPDIANIMRDFSSDASVPGSDVLRKSGDFRESSRVPYKKHSLSPEDTVRILNARGIKTGSGEEFTSDRLKTAERIILNKIKKHFGGVDPRT